MTNQPKPSDERNEKAPEGADSYSLTLNTIDYSIIFDTLEDYALRLVANAQSEMTDEQWSEYVNEITAIYAEGLLSALTKHYISKSDLAEALKDAPMTLWVEKDQLRHQFGLERE